MRRGNEPSPGRVPGENLGVYLEAQDEPLPDWMDARVVHGDETHEIHFVDEGRPRFLIRQRSKEYGIREAVATAARRKESRLTNPFEYLASLATDALYQGRDRSRPGGTRGGCCRKPKIRMRDASVPEGGSGIAAFT